jgi:hypothetical protein
MAPLVNALKIARVLAFAQHSKYCHQQQIPGPESVVAGDQIQIGWGRGALEHRDESVQPTPAHARSPDEQACADP